MTSETDNKVEAVLTPGSNVWWTVRRVANGDARRPWYELSREDIAALIRPKGGSELRDELAAALKELTFYAETSGGTAGTDIGLQNAIARAARVLAIVRGPSS